MDESQAKNRIIVALDCNEDEARSLASKLKGHARWLKVGMTLYYQAGPDFVKYLKDAGFQVFLDLKLCDIPHQVHGAARAAMASGADILSVHALGARDMLIAACEGAHEINSKAQIIAITILTSIDKKTLSRLGFQTSVAEQTELLARLATDAGCSGIVCSGQEAKALRQVVGADPLIVTPGIRLSDKDVQDQARIMTPGRALQEGSSYLVIGRPITEASDPVVAFEACVLDIVSNA